MGLFDIFTNKNAEDAAAAQQAGLRAGYQDLSQLFGQGREALTTNYTSALQPFLQQQQTGQTGTKALLDALGIGGGDPQAIQAKLAATPGYQFALDQGTQNVLRNQASTGQLASGKTNLDLQRYGQGLADQTYQSYVQNLMPFLNVAGQGASGGAGVLTGLGGGLNQSFQNQGNAAYGMQTGIGNAQANADLANNQASANIWGTIMNGAKLATSFAAMSDERLKEDIEPIGELYDGTNVYRYRYKGDPVPHIGLIAQEVEARNPDAVVEIGGFKAVRYDRATDYASKLAEFLEAA